MLTYLDSKLNKIKTPDYHFPFELNNMFASMEKPEKVPRAGSVNSPSNGVDQQSKDES